MEPHAARRDFEAKRASIEDPGVATPLTPELGANPRQQLSQLEGLRDVVDSTGIQPHHDVELLVARRQHDHFEQRVGSVDPAADVQAIHVRESEVEQDQVRLPADRGGRGLVAGSLPAHIEVVPGERSDERGADAFVVLDEQHLFGIHG